MNNNDKFEIRSDIPIKTKRSKYPFADMKVGDSFKIPEAQANRSSVSSQAYLFSKMHPEFKFTIHKQDNGELIVWRIPI